MPLRAHLARYPLPAAWGNPEMFLEEVSLGGYRTHACGLLVRHQDAGFDVSASAAEPSAEGAAARAYFELLERVAIVEASQSAAHAVCFPRAPRSRLSTYSKSSGVALHLSEARARESALAELVERDAVLRSWYGETLPWPVAAPLEPAEEPLRALYHIAAYAFAEAVVGWFAWPKDESAHPIVFGFGAGANLAAATAKAKGEALQRMAFLWGEEITPLAPDFSPSASYHQDFYLHRANKKKLEAWLRGEHFRPGPAFRVPAASGEESVEFFSLTPSWLVGRLHVVKACSRSRVPLWFGRPLPGMLRVRRPAIAIHPIA